jgi:hypothetical protein
MQVKHFFEHRNLSHTFRRNSTHSLCISWVHKEVQKVLDSWIEKQGLNTTFLSLRSLVTTRQQEVIILANFVALSAASLYNDEEHQQQRVHNRAVSLHETKGQMKDRSLWPTTITQKHGGGCGRG